MRKATSLLFLVPLSLAACDFYFGDDDPCDPYGDRAPVPGYELRNPETGRCEYFGGGGGECGDPVPLAEGDQEAGAPAFQAWPDWGYCNSACEGLDEISCTAADGCRAAYQEACPPDALCQSIPVFIGCWSVAQSGPIRGGACEGLDAYTCSIHDDCSPVHSMNPDGSYGNFSFCTAENAPCAAEVPTATERLRNPQTGVCEDYGYPCSGGIAVDPAYIPDWATCDSFCEALDENSCLAADGCRGIYVDACPACDAIVLRFGGCWGTAPSGPVRGVPCQGFDAQECSRHDDCIAVHANDWSLCADPSVPCPATPLDFLWCDAEGPVVIPPPACEELADERACIERPDCEPIYEGSGCFCDDTGCTCTTWTFLSCQTAS